MNDRANKTTDVNATGLAPYFVLSAPQNGASTATQAVCTVMPKKIWPKLQPKFFTRIGAKMPTV